MTTPRSIEKHKKNLQAKLKKAMEENVRLKNHNKSLKETNQTYLDAFCGRENAGNRAKKLNNNAARELNFKVLIFHKIRQNLDKLDVRERF